MITLEQALSFIKDIVAERDRLKAETIMQEEIICKHREELADMRLVISRCEGGNKND